ncbi:10651_t:CDS:1, partial [Gigaspora margarita]
QRVQNARFFRKIKPHRKCGELDVPLIIVKEVGALLNAIPESLNPEVIYKFVDDIHRGVIIDF